MKKVNIFTILALVLLLVGYFMPFFTKDNISAMMIADLIISILVVVLSIASIVYAKKIEKSKVFGIILLIIGILSTLLFGLLVAFIEVAKDPEKSGEFCKTVVNCQKGTDNVSTCYLENDNTRLLPIKCYTSKLNDSQFK